MKKLIKILSMLIILTLLLSLTVSCKQDEDPDAADTQGNDGDDLTDATVKELLALSESEREKKLTELADARLASLDSYKTESNFTLCTKVHTVQVNIALKTIETFSGIKSDNFAHDKFNESTSTISKDTSISTERVGYADGQAYLSRTYDGEGMSIRSEMSKDEYLSYIKNEFEDNDIGNITSGSYKVSSVRNEDGSWTVTRKEFSEEDIANVASTFMVALEEFELVIADMTITTQISADYTYVSETVEFSFEGLSEQRPTTLCAQTLYSGINETSPADVDLAVYSQVCDIRMIDRAVEAIEATISLPEASFELDSRIEASYDGQSEIIEDDMTLSYINGDDGFSFELESVQDVYKVKASYKGGIRNTVIYENGEQIDSFFDYTDDQSEMETVAGTVDIGALRYYHNLVSGIVEDTAKENTYIFTITPDNDMIAANRPVSGAGYVSSEILITITFEDGTITAYDYSATFKYIYNFKEYHYKMIASLTFTDRA